jgi:hypothetical protein
MRALLLLLLLAGCAGVVPDDSGGGIPIGDQRGAMGHAGTIGGREGVVMQRELWFPDAGFPGRR